MNDIIPLQCVDLRDFTDSTLSFKETIEMQLGFSMTTEKVAEPPTDLRKMLFKEMDNLMKKENAYIHTLSNDTLQLILYKTNMIVTLLETLKAEKQSHVWIPTVPNLLYYLPYQIILDANQKARRDKIPHDYKFQIEYQEI